MSLLRVEFLKILVALLLTLIIEIPILLVGFKKVKVHIIYKLWLFINVNVFTNVLLNTLILTDIIQSNHNLILSELIIVLIEGLLYSIFFDTIAKGKIFLMSFIANSCSFIIGLVLW